MNGVEIIEFLRFWVLQIMFWSSGAVFAYPLERRPKFKLRCIIFLVIIGYFYIMKTFWWIFGWNIFAE